MAQLSESSETERAIETGERLLRIEPLHEAAVRRLMRLYVESGRRPAAIQLFRTLADALRTEFNAQPEGETRAVLVEISRGGEERTQIPAADAKSLSSFTDTSSPGDVPTEPLPRPVSHLASTGAPLKVRSRTLGWIAAGGVAAAAVAILLSMPFASSTSPSIGIEPGKTSASNPASAISLAVLPFTNLSGDSDQEFFSDGITEEITTALAKVPGLRVVGRTSAYQFKDENRDLRAIGQALAVTHLIEGSVRKAGDRVRISVHLINANDGTDLWSENYDRLLTDIFVIQEDIARAITTSLRVPLGLKPGENLVSNRNVDQETYELFLRGMALYQTGAPQNRPDAVRIAEEIVARSPDYAPGWALLRTAYAQMANIRSDDDSPIDEARRAVREWLEKADRALERAVALDPNSPFTLSSSGSQQWVVGSPLRGEPLLLKALEVDPNDAETLLRYGNLLASAGRLKEALPLLLKSYELEPLLSLQGALATQVLWLTGKNDEAIALAMTLPPNIRGDLLANIYAAMGRFAEAADALASGGRDSVAVRETIRLLRLGPQAVPVQALGRGRQPVEFLYLQKGTPGPVVERHLVDLERDVEVGFVLGNRAIWHPAYAPVRNMERFKTFVRKAGYVEYWRAKGWPDLCRPAGADDFLCD
jgi:TolB-like protein